MMKPVTLILYYDEALSPERIIHNDQPGRLPRLLLTTFVVVVEDSEPVPSSIHWRPVARNVSLILVHSYSVMPHDNYMQKDNHQI